MLSHKWSRHNSKCQQLAGLITLTLHGMSALLIRLYRLTTDNTKHSHVRTHQNCLSGNRDGAVLIWKNTLDLKPIVLYY